MSMENMPWKQCSTSVTNLYPFSILRRYCITDCGNLRRGITCRPTMERVFHVRTSSTNSVVSYFRTCSLVIISIEYAREEVLMNKLFVIIFQLWCSFFSAGGPWLITDMERMESIFELEPSLQVRIISVKRGWECWWEFGSHAIMVSCS